jgi:chromosomal replication initiator protein DnaA
MKPTETKDNNLENLADLQTSSTNLLGEILLQEDRITEGELLEGLKKHREDGGFLGQTLIDLKFITQDELTLVLIKQCKIPHLNLQDYSIQPDVAKIIPEKLCRKYKVLPIDKMGKILTVAMVDPLDGNILHALKEVFPDLRIKPILCDWNHYKRAVNKVFESDIPDENAPLELDINIAGLPKKKKPIKKAVPTESTVDEEEPIPVAEVNEPTAPTGDVSTLLSNAIDQMADKFGAQINQFIQHQKLELQSINKRMDEINSIKNISVETSNTDEQEEVRRAVEDDLNQSANAAQSRHNVTTSDMEARLQDSLNFSANNSVHTLKNFLPGSNNIVAVNAALETANHPGEKYNPLFIFGAVGLGKTHLLNGIGQQILSAHPEYDIAYGSATHFANQLIECKAAETTNAFFKAYTNKNVLILDDVQFLGGHIDAQEEFFHIFNELQNNNGQIILAGDKAPEKLGQLEQRLISRFSGGMVVQLYPPEWETRIAILNNQLQQRNVTVPEESIAMLAMQISGDVRRLIGALIRVLSIAELQNEPVTPELTNSVLIDLGFGEAA